MTDIVILPSVPLKINTKSGTASSSLKKGERDGNLCYYSHYPAHLGHRQGLPSVETGENKIYCRVFMQTFLLWQIKNAYKNASVNKIHLIPSWQHEHRRDFKKISFYHQGFYQAVGVDDCLCIARLVGQRNCLVKESIGSMQLPPHYTELGQKTHQCYSDIMSRQTLYKCHWQINSSLWIDAIKMLSLTWHFWFMRLHIIFWQIE